MGSAETGGAVGVVTVVVITGVVAAGVVTGGVVTAGVVAGGGVVGVGVAGGCSAHPRNAITNTSPKPKTTFFESIILFIIFHI